MVKIIENCGGHELSSRAYVSLVRVSSREEGEIAEAISKATKLIDFGLDQTPRKIVIKPNLCYYWDYSTGCTTDPLVIRSVIDWVRSEISEEGKIIIAEADATAMRTKCAFKILGYEEIAVEKDVRLLNLSTDQKRKVSINTPGRKFTEFELPRTLEEADFIINVPKLKRWEPTKISCALKNIFGANAFAKKAVYHISLDEVIADINTIIKPHLNIVDGIVAMPTMGNPFRLGVIAASVDPVAVDCVVARILGLDPRSVKHVSLSAKKGVGRMDYRSVGESIKSISELYPSESKIHNLLQNLELRRGRILLGIYERVVGKME